MELRTLRSVYSSSPKEIKNSSVCFLYLGRFISFLTLLMTITMTLMTPGCLLYLAVGQTHPYLFTLFKGTYKASTNYIH